ncbi:MAG: hypothetical protein LC658_09925 [Bacteroidales bacterium]|nr:hypothetical protein [Bacteroidales bacterium]
MNLQSKNNKEFFGNFLIISGNGRNVGKTFFACRIIEFLSQKHAVTAVKISPHFHSIHENAEVLINNDDFIVFNETTISHKDSSLFLQNGATKVLFVMVSPENLEKAVNSLKPLLTEGPVICESAGLGEIIDAGLAFFLKKAGELISKNKKQSQLSQIIENDGQSLNFDIHRIGFENNQFFLKQ